ncbi:MAG TPA: heme o synthase [Nitrososphaerales archaeon]|nr:heme o synthase [Nitrososphaerales archaeon]
MGQKTYHAVQKATILMSSAVSLVKLYWELSKPKIIMLLVFTGIAGMLVAYKESGQPVSVVSLGVGVVAILLGSIGAEVLTNYHDRDIDSMLKRTHNRPIPSGRVSPRNALVFGLVTSVLSVIMCLYFNWLAAACMLFGLVDNVGVYSLWLKRRSWLNIILGGISGGMPVLVGYTAIAGAITPLALFMSALVIVWIPTHIWSLAIKEREEYKAAKIPMLPVIVSERVATVCIAITSSLLVVFSLAILFVPNAASPFYIVSAAALGAVILGYSVKLVIDKTTKTAWTLFKLSSPYLTVIFIVIVVNIWVF